jgi:hypothetical protein
LPELLRRDSFFMARLAGLAENAALLDSGLFEPTGLQEIVDQHLTGRTNHCKLLLELLTISGWLAQHSYSEVVYDS